MRKPRAQNRSKLPPATSSADKTTHQNFALVLFINGLGGADRLTLAPGYELRRATPEEIAISKRILGLTTGIAFYANPFETTRGHDGTKSSLLEEEWRYFVVALSEPESLPWVLNWTFCLAEVAARVIFTVDRQEAVNPEQFSGWSYRLDHLFHMSWEFESGTLAFREFSRDDFERTSSLLAKLRSHDETLFPLRAIGTQILHLEELPSAPFSGPQFLGHFAVLESLLTHRPKPTDPYESITRQIKSKLRLLNNRFAMPLNYAPFRQCTPDGVWSKMYAYRSCVAHGSLPDFNGELKTLVNPRVASDLLKSAVKAVVRQCLIEPKLLADLRDC